ncbi:hypothetical protein ACFORL_03155 [Legionella dresdenensis]|uniref:Outer membrane lipoprotein n=1 Tax=Legionella dresdenensis TaxID=450200 RepID=A0ABV8CDF7_9GAMM
MTKWIILLPAIVLLTACGCCVNKKAIGYREVVVTQPYQAVTVVNTVPVDVVNCNTCVASDYYY